jgi:diaminohydroxyphosphoribosylaminopyrimidine deaminase/5-amino-6-(5-phosphoribosylamino)uracil reductase
MTFMERALSLARRAQGTTSPNPPVGAVVVKDGQVVGEGWTQPAGQAHAEIVALRKAGSRASGAALYTTLEPCNHFGRTPPCTQAIIHAGIAEVHAAAVDPNPLVSGAGMSTLSDGGVETHVGEGEADSRELMEAYVKFITTGTPLVTAKFAMSLDGKIATRTGDSRWITGEEARRYVHRLRATTDAIMVGINTVLSDDPRLTARDDDGNPERRQPLRVLVDSAGRTPSDAKVLSEPGNTIVAASKVDAETRLRLTDAGAEVETVPGEDGQVDLAALAAVLGRRDVTSVLVEGGGKLLGSLFDRGLVDKVVAFVSPAIIGGEAALSPVGGVGVESMGDAMRLERVKVMHFGDDLAIIGYCGVRDDVHRNR